MGRAAERVGAVKAEEAMATVVKVEVGADWAEHRVAAMEEVRLVTDRTGVAPKE